MTTSPTSTSPKTVFETIARYTRKVIRFFFKTIGAAAIASIILAILLPPIAFAIRSTRPMNNPLFNSLNFIQIIQLRDSQYKLSVARYNAAHPYTKYPIPPEVCSWSEVARSITVSALLAQVCTLAKCSGLLVVPTSLKTYPAAIWANFEYNLIDEFNRATYQPAAVCRLPPIFPLPENPNTGQ